MYFFKREEHLNGTLSGCALVVCDLKDESRCVCVDSLDEVRRLLCRNAERERLWLQLASFLVRTRAAERFSHLNLAGSFASSAEHPREVEVYLQPHAPYGPAAFAAMEPLLELGLKEIYQRYRVRLRFWVEGALTSRCELGQAIVDELPAGGIVRARLEV